jgi:hypothetical protein
VFPLVNGNGRLNERKIALLIRVIAIEDWQYDLNFMSQMWFWPNDSRVDNLIEHHVRTFEMLASIECKKKLLAVLPGYWPKDTESHSIYSQCIKRLDRAGVPWQYSWEGVSTEILFHNLSISKTVFLRPGNALCNSWRLIDLICMGACIVCDGHPYPNWPVPLEENVNFVDCKCGVRADYSIPSKEDYQNIRTTIEDLLSNPQRIDIIRENNRNYYDNHATPEHVCAYIIETVENYAKENL